MTELSYNYYHLLMNSRKHSVKSVKDFCTMQDNLFQNSQLTRHHMIPASLANHAVPNHTICNTSNDNRNTITTPISNSDKVLKKIVRSSFGAHNICPWWNFNYTHCNSTYLSNINRAVMTMLCNTLYNEHFLTIWNCHPNKPSSSCTTGTAHYRTIPRLQYIGWQTDI